MRGPWASVSSSQKRPRAVAGSWARLGLLLALRRRVGLEARSNSRGSTLAGCVLDYCHYDAQEASVKRPVETSRARVFWCSGAQILCGAKKAAGRGKLRGAQTSDCGSQKATLTVAGLSLKTC